MWEKCIEQIIAIYMCITDTIIQILSQRFFDTILDSVANIVIQLGLVQ